MNTQAQVQSFFQSQSASIPTQYDSSQISGNLLKPSVVGTLPRVYDLPCGICETKPKRKAIGTWREIDPHVVLGEMRLYVDYLSTGGFVIIKKREGSPSCVGDILGTMERTGYRRTSFFNKKFFIHTLVWLWHNEEWPQMELDHLNGIRDDNRIENLRDVPRKLNVRNANRTSTNTSGVTWVSFEAASGRWLLRIVVDKKLVLCKRTSTKEEAIALREKWISEHPELGFTERHGKEVATQKQLQVRMQEPLEIDMAGVR